MTRSPSRLRRTLFPLSSRAESARIGEILRKETVGGLLLVVGAALALLWANSPWAEGYFALRDLEFGYEPWHLRLTLGQWAADGLLAIFFFLVGLELKREFVAGDLRRFSTAIVPVVAALGGVAVPALIYVAVASGTAGAAKGWAIPTATDIAFAVAVLAIIGSHLPSALRIFLLTLAVVDDLVAIAIIAIFYTESIQILPLLLGLAAIAVYGAIAQRYRQFFHLRPSAAWFILLPLGFVAWALVHASGVHATIAGVLLGFTIPVLHRRSDRRDDSDPGLAEVFEHRFRPISSGIAVPVFAFLSAGVAIGGADGFASALGDPVVLGIIAGLVVGKPLGIAAATWLVTRARRIDLDPSLRWIDLIGVGLLAGIGFTVSLLVAELSFSVDDPHHDQAKVAILTASVGAALLASALLGLRNRRYRRLDAD
ncbi:Na+/H+ antiporter NhaA [Microbacterium sp.]|uniref:Na+/H+ antiporter NhaA n=1 Tax=Microbacterium sp. TaxID=51671 RepID=UPI0028AFFDC3|nr:Na+/H+ antiporter NhaA [Microbacterium sp.]